MRAVVTFLCVLALASSAAAHVVVLPEESAAGGWERYTLLVPTEKKSPTVRIALKLPVGVEVVAVESKPGWEAVYEPFPLGAAHVRWSGGRIPDGQLVTFDFLAWNPKTARTLTWDATQWYEDGTSDHWGEPGNPERPASETVLTEARAGHGHGHHHHGGQEETGPAQTSAAPPATAAAPSAAPAVPAAGQPAAAGATADRAGAAPPAATPRERAPLAMTFALTALALSCVALGIALRTARRTRGRS